MHEVRRKELLGVFHRVKQEEASRKESNTNLSPSEVRGLKSLRKRVANRLLIVTETDKSIRFCILKRNQYVEAGKKNTEKDVVVDDDIVRKVQKIANEHTWWLRRIMKCDARNGSQGMDGGRQQTSPE